jgi:nucleotide-binding universal stress UspA family protein
MSHIQRILVPVDGSSPSIAALDQAVELAEDLGARIEVLNVNAPDQFSVGSSRSSAEMERQRTARRMEEAIQAASSRLADRVTRRVESGETVQKITEVASQGIDLVVIGTHGRSGRLHSLLGSVAESVVRNAPCPVLTVRRPDGEEESFAERIHHRPSLASR